VLIKQGKQFDQYNKVVSKDVPTPLPVILIIGYLIKNMA
jgi:hypothetical protein